jgi:hypothetical protein
LCKLKAVLSNFYAENLISKGKNKGKLYLEENGSKAVDSI